MSEAKSARTFWWAKVPHYIAEAPGYQSSIGDVVRALDYYAEGHADCWPTIEEIAAIAGVSARSVQLAIRWLEKSGFIYRIKDVTKRPGFKYQLGWRLPAQYLPPEPPNEVEQTPPKAPSPANNEGVQNLRPGVQNLHPQNRLPFPDDDESPSTRPGARTREGASDNSDLGREKSFPSLTPSQQCAAAPTEAHNAKGREGKVFACSEWKPEPGQVEAKIAMLEEELESLESAEPGSFKARFARTLRISAERELAELRRGDYSSIRPEPSRRVAPEAPAIRAPIADDAFPLSAIEAKIVKARAGDGAAAIAAASLLAHRYRNFAEGASSPSGQTLGKLAEGICHLPSAILHSLIMGAEDPKRTAPGRWLVAGVAAELKRMN